VQDYALWDIIKNDNSFKPVAQTTTNNVGTSTTLIPSPVTTEEKAQKNNYVKARSMLLMALPNEHLMTFNQYKNAKTLFAAIETSFDRNEATKKTQKTLLKQLYENFSDTSTENKSNLDTMSIDDLYNNFKIVEQEVKETACSNSSSQNMAFVSSPSTNGTNDVPTTYGVSIASTQSSTASTKTYMAEDEVPANISLMTFLDSKAEFESYGPKFCEIESKNSCKNIPNELKESTDAPLVKDRASELILIFCPKVEMSQDVLTTDGEAMINSIKNGNQPFPRVTQVSIAGTTSTEQPPLKDKSMCNKTAKDLWDALGRHMLGSEYGEQDRKAAVLY
nr:hypothetical protein [Tanacetum cinerariifolium]